MRNGDKSAGALGQGAGSGMRVLVVDDFPSARALVRLLVEEAGHQVIGEVGDGRRAVADAIAMQPDVVVMDWQMPAMDGIEATRQLKSALPSTVVLAFSSGEDPGIREDFLAAGASRYIHKSEPEALLSAVKQIVQPG